MQEIVRLRLLKRRIRPGEQAGKRTAARGLSCKILGQNKGNLPYILHFNSFCSSFFTYQAFLSLQKTPAPEVIQQLLLSHVWLLPALGEIDIAHSSRIVQLIEYDSLSRRRVFADS